MATNMIFSTIVWATASASTPVHRHIQRQLLLINTIFRFPILKMAKANTHILGKPPTINIADCLSLSSHPKISDENFNSSNIPDKFFGAKMNIHRFSFPISLQKNEKKRTIWILSNISHKDEVRSLENYPAEGPARWERQGCYWQKVPPQWGGGRLFDASAKSFLKSCANKQVPFSKINIF